MLTLNLSQANAVAKAGGILSATLRAEGGNFFIELETRSAGAAMLATSNQRRPRAFRNPLRALEVIRALGLSGGRFNLEEWRPDAAPEGRTTRADRAEAMRGTHAKAAEYDRWLRAEVGLAIADQSPPVPHDQVKANVAARIEALRKAKERAKT